MKTTWASLVAGILATSCSLIPPDPNSVSRAERLAAFPTERLPLVGPAEVLWNDQLVPYLVAEHDDDVPFLLGMVHAHLRMGQMEVLRLVAEGRTAEAAGPLSRDLDESLRTLDLTRAVPEMKRALPAATRVWLERYVLGINTWLERAEELPHEYAALGLTKDPWTVETVLGVGRLASADINWGRFFSLMALLFADGASFR